MTKPRIAITMGDPAGIGPEICLDLLSDSSLAELCAPIVFGDAEVLRRCAEQTKKSSDFTQMGRDDLESAIGPCVLDLGLMDTNQLKPGAISPACRGRLPSDRCRDRGDRCLPFRPYRCRDHLPGTNNP